MEENQTVQNGSGRLAGRRRLVLAAMLIAITAALAYGNTLGNEFVFDDVKIIRDNTTIRSFSNVPRIFANMFVYRPLKGQGTKIDPSYRPMRYLSYTLDYQFTGLKPAGYHISNVIYHIIASLLVFLVLKRLTGHFGAALGAAMIFVVHPVHTESVAYLTGRKDVLCTIFYLLAFLSFLRYRRQPRARYAILVPVFFALAFMAKEMAITLPAVMLLYDLGHHLKDRRGRFAEFVRGLLTRPGLAIYVPVVALALFFSAAALFLKNPAGMGEEWVGYWGGSLYVSSITMLRGITHYIRLLLVPLGLTADYSYNTFPVSRSLFSPVTTLFALYLLAALIALGIALLLRRRFLAGFAVLFFFVTLIPVLQIVPLPERLAERFLYLPSLSLMLLGAMGLSFLLKRGGSARTLGIAATVLIVVTFFGLTARRNSDWKDPLTLHGSVIARYPDCARSRLAVAESFAERASATRNLAGGALTPAAEKDYLNAVHHFGEVLRILPPETWQGWRRGYALNALTGRGIACANLGKYDRAVSDLRKVLGETDVFGSRVSENPDYLHVHFNLGEALYSKKEFEGAIEEFDTTARMAKERQARDYLIKAYFKKALALAGTGRLPEGLEVLNEASTLAKGTLQEIEMYYHIGLFQLDLKKDEEAIKSFEKVLELCELYERDPLSFAVSGPQAVILGIDRTKSQSYYMLAQAYDRQCKLDDAVRVLQKAVEVAPDFLAARFSLGDFYFKMGRLNAAETQFRRVLKSQPGHDRSKQYLALIEAKRRTLEERKKPAPQKVLLLHEAALRDYRSGELELAKDKLFKALEIAHALKPGERPAVPVARVRLLLGRIRMSEGELDDAKTHLRACLDALAGLGEEGVELPLGEGNYYLGFIRAAQGDRAGSLAYLRKAVPLLRKAALLSRSSVEAADLLLHSAQANRLLEKYDQELADYLRAAGMLPQYPSVHYHAAQAAVRAGKFADAARLYMESVKRGEKVVESYFEMGKFLFERGKHTDAIVNFESALKKTSDPHYLAACNYYLGHAYYAVEFYEEAAAAWREYLKHEKDPEKRDLMEQKLASDPKLKQK